MRSQRVSQRTSEANKALSQKKTQTRLDCFVQVPLSKKEQEEKDQLVIDYILAEARPLQTVEKESFIRFAYGLNPRVKIMGVKKLRCAIQDAFRAYQTDLRKEFQKVSFVCLTTDAWSSRRRSFIANDGSWDRSEYAQT